MRASSTNNSPLRDFRGKEKSKFKWSCVLTDGSARYCAQLSKVLAMPEAVLFRHEHAQVRINDLRTYRSVRKADDLDA